jgi:hypothetical protein
VLSAALRLGQHPQAPHCILESLLLNVGNVAAPAYFFEALGNFFFRNLDPSRQFLGPELKQRFLVSFLPRWYGHHVDPPFYLKAGAYIFH